MLKLGVYFGARTLVIKLGRLGCTWGSPWTRRLVERVRGGEVVAARPAAYKPHEVIPPDSYKPTGKATEFYCIIKILFSFLMLALSPIVQCSAIEVCQFVNFFS